MSRQRIKITKIFKRNGLSLMKDGIAILIKYLEDEGSWDEKEAKVEDVISRLKDKGVGDGKVTADRLQQVFQMVEDGLDGDDLVLDEPFKIVDAFDHPHFQYYPVEKQFRLVDKKSRMGNAKDRTKMMMERYNIILQRVLRHEHVQHTSEGADMMNSNENAYVVTTTQNLVGETGRMCVFGVLREAEKGKLALEDLDGSIEVDVTDASLDRDSGFYTYNSFVLAEGTMDDGIFKISVLAFPPYEPREKTIDVFPKLDFLPQAAKKDLILETEKAQTDTSFIFVSELYLDDPKVIKALAKMFAGYGGLDQPPSVFVLMGNFTRQHLQLDATDLNLLRRCFDKLTDMICEHKNLVEMCRFVLIPGPRDPVIGNVLPRRGFMNTMTAKMRQKLNCEFPSNPCRIQYFTQEILLVRENLQRKLQRNTVLPCELGDADEMSNHMIKSIMDQSHLAPLPMLTQPVFWNCDHALRLYPAPTVLVIGDQHNWYKFCYENDVNVVNPGQFFVDYAFVVYYPASRDFDYSEIKLDM